MASELFTAEIADRESLVKFLSASAPLDFGGGVGVDFAAQRDFFELWFSPLHKVRNLIPHAAVCQDRCLWKSPNCLLWKINNV